VFVLIAVPVFNGPCKHNNSLSLLIFAVSFSCKFAGASVGSADWQSARNGKPGEFYCFNSFYV